MLTAVSVSFTWSFLCGLVEESSVVLIITCPVSFL